MRSGISFGGFEYETNVSYDIRARPLPCATRAPGTRTIAANPSPATNVSAQAPRYARAFSTRQAATMTNARLSASVYASTCGWPAAAVSAIAHAPAAMPRAPGRARSDVKAQSTHGVHAAGCTTS